MTRKPSTREAGETAKSEAQRIDVAIQDAIVSLMANTDFSKITVRDVAAHAGIARSSFYRYFESVEDAVLRMEDEFFDELERINRSSLQALSLSGASMGATASQVQRFDYFRERSALILAVDGPHGDPAFRLRSERTFSQYYAQRMKGQGLSADKLGLYTSFAAAGHYAMVRKWLTDCPDVSSLEMAEITNRLFYSTPSLVEL